MEHVDFAVFGGLALAADGKGVFLDLDGQVAIGEAGNRDRDAIGILAGALDVVGRVARGRIDADELVEHREKTVEADRVAVEGSKIVLSHGISSA
jgi:hypothetical protein